MKSLFNVAAAFVRVNVAMIQTMEQSFRKEGVIVAPFVKELREGFEASELPSALQQYMRALVVLSAVPAWALEARKEIDLFKRTWKRTEASMATAEAIAQEVRQ